MKAFLYLIPVCLLAACGSSKKTTAPRDIIIPDSEPVKTAVANNDASVFALKKKYAQYLQTAPDSITNIRLYRFIDEWLHTPYLWGGTDRRGIDCSAFIQRLLNEVYSIRIPRTSVQQFFTENVEPFGGKHYLHEGDLVFFQTIDNTVISHVGLYLGNNRFVNSSSSEGVSIADLTSPYWKKRYVASGRVKTSKNW